MHLNALEGKEKYDWASRTCGPSLPGRTQAREIRSGEAHTAAVAPMRLHSAPSTRTRPCRYFRNHHPAVDIGRAGTRARIQPCRYWHAARSRRSALSSAGQRHLAGSVARRGLVFSESPLWLAGDLACLHCGRMPARLFDAAVLEETGMATEGSPHCTGTQATLKRLVWQSMSD